MNIEITGTHKAGEILVSLAGSKLNRPTRRINQRRLAKVGSIVSVCFAAA
jgi:hypothetical protein